MKSSRIEIDTSSSNFIVHVSESPERKRRGIDQCLFEKNINFDLTGIQLYFFAGWNPRLFDALLVAGSVEYADRIRRRPSLKWSRQFELHIPVHDPVWWNSSVVNSALIDCLQFLTGDQWSIQFHRRNKPYPQPLQLSIPLEPEVEAVIPFSEGLDSFIVSHIFGKSLGPKLVKVRLGSLPKNQAFRNLRAQPFSTIPYSVNLGHHRPVESSARSRGFKFLLMAGLAAYLAKANKVIIPESGQGVLGPVLVPVGQMYEDYRNHPLFTRKLEIFLELLVEKPVRFEFPQL